MSDLVVELDGDELWLTHATFAFAPAVSSPRRLFSSTRPIAAAQPTALSASPRKLKVSFGMFSRPCRSGLVRANSSAAAMALQVRASRK